MAQNTSSQNSSNFPVTTGRLMKMLSSSPGQFLETYIPAIRDTTFHEYLYNLLERQDKSVADLIQGACISKAYAYQFINGERVPGRNIILRIGIFLDLSLDDIQRLLTLAGKSVLYPKLRRDAGILYCIRKKLSLDETNSFLEDLGEGTLL